MKLLLYRVWYWWNTYIWVCYNYAQAWWGYYCLQLLSTCRLGDDAHLCDASVYYASQLNCSTLIQCLGWLYINMIVMLLLLCWLPHSYAIFCVFDQHQLCTEQLQTKALVLFILTLQWHTVCKSFLNNLYPICMCFLVTPPTMMTWIILDQLI